MTKTRVYIDGLNLYYAALRGTQFKWLDLAALCKAVLPNTCNIVEVNYYTAHVKPRVDPGAPKRQNAYLRALETNPLIKIHYGKHMVTKKWAGLVTPPDFKPDIPAWKSWIISTLLNVRPEVAFIWKTEEKGSDVNLGVHLVRDALKGDFEHAAVLTNDTDLLDAFRIVTQEAKLPVTLLAPNSRPSTSLVRLSTHVRHIQPYLGACQLPNPVRRAGKPPIERPADWT